MILFGVSGIIGALGLFAILSRGSLLGVLVGLQILFLGASTAFVFGGILSGERLSGHVVSILVEILSVGLIVAGYAVAVRLFYLKGKGAMSEARFLKR